MRARWLADDADLEPWYGAYRAAHDADDPGEPAWLLDEVRAQAGTDADDQTVLAVAEDGPTVVGALMCTLPLRDNRHVVLVDHLAVAPSARRRGVGSALHALALTHAIEHGRTTLIAEVLAPGAEDRDVPGDHAARAWGYRLASRDHRRTLRLPLAPGVADTVRAAIGTSAADYDIVTWQGPTPQRFLADRALIQARMSTDTPLGDLSWQAEQWDGDRLRRLEATIAEMGRVAWSAGAVHRATSQLVAATWLLGHPDTPDQLWQWDTLVLPEHRGHRLGLAIKLANIEQVARARPSTRRVATGNAADNAPMVAVNDALGFEVTGHWREYQRTR